MPFYASFHNQRPKRDFVRSADRTIVSVKKVIQFWYLWMLKSVEPSFGWWWNAKNGIIWFCIRKKFPPWIYRWKISGNFHQEFPFAFFITSWNISFSPPQSMWAQVRQHESVNFNVSKAFRCRFSSLPQTQDIICINFHFYFITFSFELFFSLLFQPTQHSCRGWITNYASTAHTCRYKIKSRSIFYRISRTLNILWSSGDVSRAIWRDEEAHAQQEGKMLKNWDKNFANEISNLNHSMCSSRFVNHQASTWYLWRKIEIYFQFC